jgi:hypothetical protein
MIVGTPCGPLAALVMKALFPLPILFSALRLSGRHELRCKRPNLAIRSLLFRQGFDKPPHQPVDSPFILPGVCIPHVVQWVGCGDNDHCGRPIRVSQHPSRLKSPRICGVRHVGRGTIATAAIARRRASCPCFALWRPARIVRVESWSLLKSMSSSWIHSAASLAGRTNSFHNGIAGIDRRSFQLCPIVSFADVRVRLESHLWQWPRQGKPRHILQVVRGA